MQRSHRRRAWLTRCLAVMAVLTVGAVAWATPAGAGDASNDASVVRTAGGLVRGTVGTGFRAFLGIPFAAPPVGSLRWKAPQSAGSWSGVRDATAFGNACAQAPAPFP